MIDHHSTDEDSARLMALDHAEDPYEDFGPWDDEEPEEGPCGCGLDPACPHP